MATAPGRGGIGIIRVSGPRALAIGEAITDRTLRPRHAFYTNFFEQTGDSAEPLDQGIALFYPGPRSYTGEDVVEFQGHGGPVVLDMLLKEVLRLGAKLARPGQFSERAFLNDKIDLSQAEAIADLINSSSQQAARSALQSLQGEFSRRINRLIEALIELRAYVEASIDFPEEEIDFLSDGKIEQDLESLMDKLDRVFCEAQQGAILREGMSVVIAGKPNAGKSSLLNALTDKDIAIVSALAGTTRDVLKEYIHIDGMPLHIIDTAGLRDDPDEVEGIGIERAWREIRNADRVLLLSDSTLSSESNPLELCPEFIQKLGDTSHVTLVRSKCDCSGLTPGSYSLNSQTVITLSSKTGQGLNELKQHLKSMMGYTSGEGNFIARRRHLEALERARKQMIKGREQLQQSVALELLADDLFHAQQALSEITGEYRADDLLGHIFSSFCIGK